MALAVSVYPNKHRADSTILPLVTATDIAGKGWIQIGNFLYYSFGTGTLAKRIIPPNATEKAMGVKIKDLISSYGAWIYDAGIGSTSDSIIRNSGGPDWSGAYYPTPLTAANCSIQATTTSTMLSSGISLQDSGGAIHHNYENPAVRHSMIFGQDKLGSIRENGALVKNNTFFKYEEGDTGLIEAKNGVCRYYLVKANGKMELIRATRSKITTATAIGETLLFYTGSELVDALVFGGTEVLAVFETIGVAYKEVFWQKWQNPRVTTPLADTLEMADKRVEYTYPNQKTMLRSIALTPKARSLVEFWKMIDFINHHKNDKEFIFVDYARKDLDKNPTEMWAHFQGGFTDSPINPCQFENSVQIVEDFRTEYFPRFDDLIPPLVTVTAIDAGTFIVTGTASDDILLVSVQLYVNGAAYGAPFLPDGAGNWVFPVDENDLDIGTNYFYAIATDYAGNQTQSNTVTLEIGVPVLAGEFTLGGEPFTLGGQEFTLGV